MTRPSEDIEGLITAIKTHTKGDKVTAGAVALVELIPFAGGAVASIIGEVSVHRRFEKVCDVLSDLNARLEEKGAVPEQHLSKDQIIEVVHETLQTVTTASDRKKIESLKNGLAYAFLSDDLFEWKQLLLQVLRGCTSLELVMLPTIYDSGDPFVVHEGQPPPVQPGPTLTSSSVLWTTGSQINPHEGSWVPIGNREQCREQSLLTFLASRVGMDEGGTEGAVRLLDSKGLASAGPNLQRRDCQVLEWQESRNGVYLSPFVGTSVNPALRLPSSMVKPTPLEDSRTKFGKDFLGFCRT